MRCRPKSVISTDHDGAKATESEWRDPENASPTRLIQGILPVLGSLSVMYEPREA